MTSNDERKGYAIENLGNGVTTIVAEMARMRHEIARLKGELERVQTESADAFHHRDGPPPYPSDSELLVRLSEENERLQDKLTAMRIVQKEEHEILDKLSEENDQLKDELVQQSITLRAEHQRAERILAKLREPSEAVWEAAVEAFEASSGSTFAALCAAVEAAEQEVVGER